MPIRRIIPLILIKLDISWTLKQLGAVEVVYPNYNSEPQVRLVVVDNDGSAAAFSQDNAMGCATSIGCYKEKGSTDDSIADMKLIISQTYEPLDCYKICTEQLGKPVAAVQGNKCACFTSTHGYFTKTPPDPTSISVTTEPECPISCTGQFHTPLCGGFNGHWNLFVCYTHSVLGSTTIDPWRGILFTSVAISWRRINAMNPSDQLPINSTEDNLETYFLFAADISSGKPRLEYHLRQMIRKPSNDSPPLVNWINAIYRGIQFDVDSSRIVAFACPSDILNISESQQTFGYFLVSITFKSLDKYTPIITQRFSVFYSDILTKEDIFDSSDFIVNNEQTALNFMLGMDNSGIVSVNGLDTYIFTISYGMEDDKRSSIRSKLLFVDCVPSDQTTDLVDGGSSSGGYKYNFGHVFYIAPLDCFVLQLAVNGFYGDVGVMAQRNGNIEYFLVARVYRDSSTMILDVDPVSIGSSVSYVVPVSDTANLNLLAGVVATDNIYNKTCHGIMLYDSVDVSVTEPDQEGTLIGDREVLNNQPQGSDPKKTPVPSVLCFDTRTHSLSLWGGASGTAKTSEDGVVSTAVSMSLYQRDPGFPMSLPRAELESCEMSTSGLSVIVKFNAVTLMGASCMDTDFDGIPDTVDYSTEVVDSVLATECFAESSHQYLEKATCLFTQKDVLTLHLDKVSTCDFGNTLCIKPNFVCRYQNGNWSGYTSGCCQVRMPSSLEKPKPILRADPSLVVDVCSEVTLDLGDTQFCGKKCSFVWMFIGITTFDEMRDLQIPIDQQQILESLKASIKNQIVETLNSANSLGSSIVFLGAEMLLRAAYHVFQVEITSSWGLSSLYEFVIHKLDISAPTVAIIGDSEVGVSVNEPYELQVLGRASKCRNEQSSIGYNWSYGNCSVALPLVDTIKNQNQLYIPAGTHSCPIDSGWDDERFGVVCEKCIITASVHLLDDPSRKTQQTLSVHVYKSSVIARCYNPDSSIISRKSAIYLNCGNSEDPDDLQSGSFKGTFTWSCYSLTTLLPCFSFSSVVTGPPSLFSPEEIPAEMINRCDADYTLPRIMGDGGILYPPVNFSPGEGVCNLERGVLTLNTISLNPDDYRLVIDILHFDGRRSAHKNIDVKLVDAEMPLININVSGYIKTGGSSSYVKDGEYLITSGKIVKFRGTHNLDSRSVGFIKYSFELLEKQRNLEYNENLAIQYFERGEPYVVQKHIYVHVDLLGGCVREGTADWTSMSPTLTLGPYCLKNGTGYKVRLLIDWTPLETQEELSSFADIRLSTASGPPTQGKFTIHTKDLNGAITHDTSCDLERLLSADDWVTSDTPILYRFGYIVDYIPAVGDPDVESLLITDSVKYWFTDSSVPVRYSLNRIPCGLRSNGYKTIVFVKIETSLGEATYRFKEILSTTPINPTEIAEGLILSAQREISGNPEKAISEMMLAMSLVRNEDIDVRVQTGENAFQPLSETSCMTNQCGDRHLILLNTLMDSSLNTGGQETMVVALQGAMLDVIENSLNRMNTGSELMTTDSGVTNIYSGVSNILRSSMALLSVQNEPIANENLIGDAAILPNALMIVKSQSAKKNAKNSLSNYKMHLAPYNTPFINEDSLNKLRTTRGKSAVLQMRRLHEKPSEYGDLITDCPYSRCEVIGLICMHQSESDRFQSFVCCPDVNKYTSCYEPPCLFAGTRCSYSLSVYGNSKESLDGNVMFVDDLREWKEWRYQNIHSLQLGYEMTERTQLGLRIKKNKIDSLISDNLNQSNQNQSRINYNAKDNKSPISYSSATSRLGIEFDDTVILYHYNDELHNLELPILVDSLEKTQSLKEERRFSLRNKILSSLLDTSSVDDQRVSDLVEYYTQKDLNATQVIKRSLKAIREMSKTLITTMVSNEPPRVFDTPSFRVYIGKTTDLSTALPQFIFPSRYTVPADSPDDPTPENPVTGFSYEYVEYHHNIFEDIDMSPEMRANPWMMEATEETLRPQYSSEFSMRSLVVMNANPDIELVASPFDAPVLVFADTELYASATCARWDVFSNQGVAGGWSQDGIVNDGRGCLLTHMGEFSVFIDPREFKPYVFEGSYNDFSVTEVTVSTRLLSFCVLSFIYVFFALMCFWGFRSDELMKDKIMSGDKTHKCIWIGDGITDPMGPEDPIPYYLLEGSILEFLDQVKVPSQLHVDNSGPFSKADLNSYWKRVSNKLFLHTLWNVMKLHNALISPLTFSEDLSRTQKITCLLSIPSGIMGLASLVAGNPRLLNTDEDTSSRTFITSIATGLATSLIIYPIYFIFYFMFKISPKRRRARLPKRRMERDPGFRKGGKGDQIEPKKELLLKEDIDRTVGNLGTGVWSSNENPGRRDQNYRMRPLPSISGFEEEDDYKTIPINVRNSEEMNVGSSFGLSNKRDNLAGNPNGNRVTQKLPPIYFSGTSPIDLTNQEINNTIANEENDNMFSGSKPIERDNIVQNREQVQSLRNHGSLFRRIPPPPSSTWNQQSGSSNAYHSCDNEEPNNTRNKEDNKRIFKEEPRHSADPSSYITPPQEQTQESLNNPLTINNNINNVPSTHPSYSPRTHHSSGTSFTHSTTQITTPRSVRSGLLSPRFVKEMKETFDDKKPEITIENTPLDTLPLHRGESPIGMRKQMTRSPLATFGESPDRALLSTPREGLSTISGISMDASSIDENSIVPFYGESILPIQYNNDWRRQSDQKLQTSQQLVPVHDTSPSPGNLQIVRPPPPLQEGTSDFIARIKEAYFIRSEKQKKQDDIQKEAKIKKKIPSIVYRAMIVIPYIATLLFSVLCVLILVNYSFYFTEEAERQWYVSSIAGLFTSFLVLDMIRSFVIALTEMKDFENRLRKKIYGDTNEENKKVNEKINEKINGKVNGKVNNNNMNGMMISSIGSSFKKAASVSSNKVISSLRKVAAAMRFASSYINLNGIVYLKNKFKVNTINNTSDSPQKKNGKRSSRMLEKLRASRSSVHENIVNQRVNQTTEKKEEKEIKENDLLTPIRNPLDINKRIGSSTVRAVKSIDDNISVNRSSRQSGSLTNRSSKAGATDRSSRYLKRWD